MKIPILLSALLSVAVAASAQPAVKTGEIVNDLPFPLVTPAKAQDLTVQTPIVLKLDNVTLGAALDELQKQSGVELGFSPDLLDDLNGKTLSIDLETLSFNRAFDAILDEADVQASLQHENADGPWIVEAYARDDGRDAPQSGAGLFAIRLSEIRESTEKSVRLRESRAPERVLNQNSYASLVLDSDLRLPIIGTPQTRLTRADDETGRSMMPEGNDLEIYQRKPQPYGFYTDNYLDQSRANVPLLKLDPPAKMLAHLEGNVVYALISRREKWAIADLLSAPQWTHSFASEAGNIDLKIAATANAEGDLLLEIEVTSAQNVPDEQVRQPLMIDSQIVRNLRIEDGQNTGFRIKDYNATQGDDKNEFTISATFESANENKAEEAIKSRGPLKLTFNAPVEIVQTEVPFSFSNIRLP